jgi:GDP-4-dehydro-6-deoxy-D-mannose reductase
MSLKKNNFLGKFLFVSSSEVYGLLSDSDLPVSEDHPLRPQSPYAVAKIASEALCYQWSQIESFEIITARPFNHIGPGQSGRFAIANFGRQIAEIKLGLKNPIIHVGNVHSTRDFLDVRDIASAYGFLLEQGKNGEVYNICSGIERSIFSLIRRMSELIDVQVDLCFDAARVRVAENSRSSGDNNKLLRDTKWLPNYALDQTLLEILDFWVKKITT